MTRTLLQFLHAQHPDALRDNYLTSGHKHNSDGASPLLVFSTPFFFFFCQRWNPRHSLVETASLVFALLMPNGAQLRNPKLARRTCLRHTSMQPPEQDRAPLTDGLVNGPHGFKVLPRRIYHGNQKFARGRRHRQSAAHFRGIDLVVLSGWITKINSVVFPWNVGQMFGLSTGGLADLSLRRQRCVCAKQICGPSAEV